MSELPDVLYPRFHPNAPVKRSIYYDKVYSDGLIETLREAIEERDEIIMMLQIKIKNQPVDGTAD